MEEGNSKQSQVQKALLELSTRVNMLAMAIIAIEVVLDDHGLLTKEVLERCLPEMERRINGWGTKDSRDVR